MPSYSMCRHVPATASLPRTFDARWAVFLRVGRTLALSFALAASASAQTQTPPSSPAGIALDAPWKQAVFKFATENLQHSAWGVEHSERDYLLATRLAAQEKLPVDADILFAAAFLHDVAGALRADPKQIARHAALALHWKRSQFILEREVRLLWVVTADVEQQFHSLAFDRAAFVDQVMVGPTTDPAQALQAKQQLIDAGVPSRLVRRSLLYEPA